MNYLLIDFFYGLTMLGAGGAAGWWLSRRRGGAADAQQRQSAEALARLHTIIGQVAGAVNAHNSRVEQINEELSAADAGQAMSIEDAIARLLRANQQMQEKLDTTQDTLREQAEQIQVHAVEARTDALTLLANRRGLDDELERRVAEFASQGKAFSVIVADADHFKRLNDTFGHQVGDEVLRGLAKSLRRAMRDGDLVARYGGEEFTVVLPGTPAAEACLAAERARAAVERWRGSADGKDVRVTVSLGVAQIGAGEDGAAVVRRADEALYAAKDGGRNRVYWHDGQTVKPAVAPAEPEPPAVQVSSLSTVVQVANLSAVVQVANLSAVGQVSNLSSDEPSPKVQPEIAAAPEEPKPSRVTAADASELPNRTAFCQHVRLRLAEWKRGGAPFCVLLAQIGRCGGENAWASRTAAVQAAARFFEREVREMDLLGHYAPGCLSLLLPSATLSDAMHIGARLRHDFIQHHVLSAVDDRSSWNLSLGVVQAVQEDDLLSLLRRAEMALEEACRQGPNCVCYHDGERCAPVHAADDALACWS